jgi:hypothetical protein
VQGRQPGGITVTLQAVAEPKVGAGEYAIATIEEYRDDRGQSLLTSGAQTTFTSVAVTRGELSGPSDDGWLHAWSWTVPLQLPSPAPGRRIGTLRGQFGVAVGAPGRGMVVADLVRARGQSFEWDGVILTVTSVRAAGSQHVVSGEISAPSDSPLTMEIRNVGSTGATAGISPAEYLGLLDTSRKVIPRSVRVGRVRSEGNRTVLEWTLTRLEHIGDPALYPNLCHQQCVPVAVTWAPPTETRWFIVPFELHNIEVP